MAEFEGVNTARLATGGKYDVGEFNGHVKVLKDTYVFGANVFATTDSIKIGTLPKGAKIIGGGIAAESMGTTGIFDLGTAADDDGIVDGADAGGQAAVKKASTEALLGSKLAAATDIFITASEATDAADGDEVTAWVEYVVD